MKKKIKRVAVLIVGIAFVILGLAGLVLPFLQGLLFLAIGVLILSFFSPTLRTWMDKHTVKWPKLHQAVLAAEGWMIRVIGRPEDL